VRDRLQVPVEIDREEATSQALNSAGARRSLNGRAIARVIYVPGKLINVVTKR
jgi:leucyl-tRNA synthetase